MASLPLRTRHQPGSCARCHAPCKFGLSQPRQVWEWLRQSHSGCLLRCLLLMWSQNQQIAAILKSAPGLKSYLTALCSAMVAAAFHQSGSTAPAAHPSELDDRRSPQLQWYCKAGRSRIQSRCCMSQNGALDSAQQNNSWTHDDGQACNGSGNVLPQHPQGLHRIQFHGIVPGTLWSQQKQCSKESAGVAHVAVRYLETLTSVTQASTLRRIQLRFTAATCSVKQGAVNIGGGTHNASGLICESEPR